MTLNTLRDIFIGPPLPTLRMAHEKLDNFKALAALSPDALASIAYANQEIYLGLAVAGAAGLAYSWTIAVAIAGLLGVLALSYSQTITAYPTGGGSYTVARENLGDTVGLVAAAALLTDYILNVAVSVTAGVEAATSALPALIPYRTIFALVLLAIITIANLRGLREAGAVMLVPVYLFVGTYLFMIGVGLVRIALGEPAVSYAVSYAPQAPVATLTLALVLHAFATGCTALTGVEAMSNGVPVFRDPAPKNANRTMAAMAMLMGVLFLGTIGLTQYFGVVKSADETVLSALTHHLFRGWPVQEVFYYFVQTSTLLVLMVAANTSFMDFPRVSSILARDGFMPRQMSLLGDRLVFTNGILSLAGLAALLVIIFQGDTHLLIPLFAIGAFMAFTLSQAGMVRHWYRKREGRTWWLKLIANGLGVLATAVALSIIAYNKFSEGAWIVMLLIPAQVLVFRSIRTHYRDVREQLTLYVGLPPDLRPLPEPRVVLPIGGVHRGIIQALRYAHSIARNVKAVYIEVEPGGSKQIRERWDEWGLDEDAELVIVESPYRSIVAPFIEYLDDYDHEANDGQLATVLLPEFVTAHWWEQFLHNQTAWLIKLTLLYRRRSINKIRAIIDVPMYLQD